MDKPTENLDENEAVSSVVVSSKTSKKTKQTETGMAKPTSSNLIAIVSLIIAMGAVLFGLHMQTNTQTQLKQQKDQLKLLLGQRQQLQTLQSTIQAQQAMVVQQQQTLKNIKQLVGRENIDWVLADAKYLVTLAQYNLHFAHNVSLAIRLLQTADKKLQSLSVPSLLSVRQALATDIANLQAVPKEDLAGLLSHLYALNQQIAQLPTITQRFVKSKPKISQAPTPDKPHTWRQALNASWRQLQQLVVIRHHNKPIEPLLSVEQQTYLRQNLDLLLQQAQWAALNRNELIYKKSLIQAQQWLRMHFIQDNVHTKQVLKTLANISKRDINPKLPTINKSLQAMTSAIHSRKQKVKNTTQAVNWRPLPKVKQQISQSIPDSSRIKSLNHAKSSPRNLANEVINS